MLGMYSKQTRARYTLLDQAMTMDPASTAGLAAGRGGFHVWPHALYDSAVQVPLSGCMVTFHMKTASSSCMKIASRAVRSDRQTTCRRGGYRCLRYALYSVLDRLK